LHFLQKEFTFTNSEFNLYHKYMNQRGLTIRQKILLGFFLLIFTFGGYGLYSIFVLNQNGDSIKASKEVIDPSLDAIKDLKLMVINSKQLTYTWIYSPPGASTLKQDQQALKDLHNAGYPQLKERLQGLIRNWKDSSQVVKMDTIFTKFEGFLKVQKMVMSKIVTIEDANNLLFEMNETIENAVLPQASVLVKSLDILENEKRNEKNISQAQLIDNFDQSKTQVILLILILTITGIGIAFTLTGNIVQPITYINSVISLLGKGELPEDKKSSFRKDEIGQIASSVDGLINGLRATSLFAENIGQGNYNASFQPLSESDVLGNALIEMRNNLSKVAEEDRRRNWAADGIAKFAEILRKINNTNNEVESDKKNQNQNQNLMDTIISELVRYTSSNQGGLFIVEKPENEKEEPYLQMEACYAWDKKKYLEQVVYMGDGLTGQAWQEQATIYLTDVPDDYVMITSGLGQSNPNSILIVPLRINDEVFGVVEIASFNHFESYQIEFVERIAESIASTIATLKNTEQINKYLQDSKMLTEQMKSQEEEMRQNMDTLQATQEDMEKSQMLAKEKEAIFDANTSILYVNKKFAINQVNLKSMAMLGYTESEFQGMSLNKLFALESKFEELKINLERGEYWNSIVTIKNKKNEDILMKVSGGAVGVGLNKDRYIVVLDDINDIKLIQG
jgi:PAS domain S-box-containing protein